MNLGLVFNRRNSWSFPHPKPKKRGGCPTLDFQGWVLQFLTRSRNFKSGDLLQLQRSGANRTRKPNARRRVN